MTNKKNKSRPRPSRAKQVAESDLAVQNSKVAKRKAPSPITSTPAVKTVILPLKLLIFITEMEVFSIASLH